MKLKNRTFVLLVMLFFPVGCAHQGTLFDVRHVTVLTETGAGSAVYLGRGLIMTARHVLFAGNEITGRRLLYFNGMYDSNFVVVSTVGNMVLLKSFAISNRDFLHVESPQVGMSVMWTQVFYVPKPNGGIEIYKLVMRGVVAGRMGEYLLVDRPVWPGASGSGVYDSLGRLVGVIYGHTQFTTLQHGAMFGIFSPVPGEIKDLLEQEEQVVK